MSTTASAPPARAARALRRIELGVFRRLDGILQGDYLGLVPAPGSEPGEGREYAPGDDVRRMDWNLTARTAAPHVRDTVADRELETWVVVDRSASLDFGTAAWEKRDLALAAVAAVGYLTIRGGNRIGSLVLGPDGSFVVPAVGGQAALHSLLLRLDRMERRDGPHADTSRLADGLVRATKVARRRGLVVVVSDFLDGREWERPLRALAARHDVLAMEVVDPRELELPSVGLLTLVDPESGRRLEVQTASQRLRDRYAEAAAEQRAEIARTIRAAGAEHLQLRTDRDWVLDLVRFVAARKRRRAGRAVAR